MGALALPRKKFAHFRSKIEYSMISLDQPKHRCRLFSRGTTLVLLMGGLLNAAHWLMYFAIASSIPDNLKFILKSCTCYSHGYCERQREVKQSKRPATTFGVAGVMAWTISSYCSWIGLVFGSHSNSTSCFYNAAI